MYIDSHTHLNSPKLFWNWKGYISDFEKIWGEFIVNTWADDEYNRNWIKISQEYNGNVFVKSTIWYHPYEIECNNIIKENIEEKMKELKQMYIDNKEHIVAIWEAWIDVSFNKENSKLELQKELFRAQCELAKELWLPIVIHSRDDIDSTLEVLKKYKDLKIYFHCWGYGTEEVKKVENMFENVWIGFCANITYPKAQNIRDSLAVVNKNNILLETDAPYLPPQEFRWKTNYPSYVKYIYKFVSKELNIDETKLKEIVKNNFEKLYL